MKDRTVRWVMLCAAATLTAPRGGALHRGSLAGGTRLLVDTDGIADVPVSGGGSPTSTNIFGKAVICGCQEAIRAAARIV